VGQEWASGETNNGILSLSYCLKVSTAFIVLIRVLVPLSEESTLFHFEVPASLYSIVFFVVSQLIERPICAALRRVRALGRIFELGPCSVLDAIERLPLINSLLLSTLVTEPPTPPSLSSLPLMFRHVLNTSLRLLMFRAHMPMLDKRASQQSNSRKSRVQYEHITHTERVSALHCPSLV